MYSRVPPSWGSTSRWRGVRHHKGRSQRHKGSPYSPMNRTTKVWFTFHYRNPSRRKPEPLQQQPEAQPTTGLGAPGWLQLTTKVSITTKASRVQRPKSNKFTNFQLPRILVESTNRCTMQWQEHTKCSSPSLSNSNTATNANGGIREEEQRGETPRTPRLRSTRFPSLRGGMDWWKCRSRSPLSNPTKSN